MRQENGMFAYERKPQRCPSCKSLRVKGDKRRRAVITMHIGQAKITMGRETIGWICRVCGWYEMYYTFKDGEMVLNHVAPEFSKAEYVVGDIINKNGVILKK